jgi:phosphoglycolate phosphatase
MKFKAVLFDLDGTLLDTIQDLADSMNAVLIRSGFPTHCVDDYKNFVGDGMVELAKRVLPKDKLNEETVNRCVFEMREEYSKRWTDKTKPYDGIKELLDSLTVKKVKLTVLSNKPHDFTKVVVAKFFSDWHFDAVYGERPSVPKKPDPSGAMDIARIINIQPCEFLYLGDTNVDMKTANSAGMYAVGASWGFRKIDELLVSGARAIVNHPLEVLGLL